MANYINQELSKIIRDISYGGGSIRKLRGLIQRLSTEQKKLELRLSQIPLEIAEAQAVLAEQKEKLAAAKEIAKKRYPRLPLEDIRPVVPTPKLGDWKRGDFKRELIYVLRSAKGPVTTRQLMDHCVARFGIAEDRQAKRNKLSDQVSRRLREMAAKGFVKRLPSRVYNEVAKWVWVGAAD